MSRINEILDDPEHSSDDDLKDTLRMNRSYDYFRMLTAELLGID